MSLGNRARVAASRRRGPSRSLVAAIVVPVLALLAGLILWAFSVRDWTWFSLLIAAAVGVSGFVVAPDLFSIRDSAVPEDWCLTMRPRAHGPDILKARANAQSAGEHTEKNAPNRSA
jgi:hypothetical protein